MKASFVHWLGLGLLAFLAARLAMIATRVRRDRLPWTRLLIPAALLVEGCGLLFTQTPGPWRAAKIATALALELGLLGLVAHRFLRLRPEPGVLPEDHLAEPLAAFLPPRLARLIALETVLLGSALRFLAGGWRRPDPPGLSYHRASALAAILPALPLLLLSDLVLLEVMLRTLQPWIRALIHALDLYGILWVLGLWAGFRRRPHRVDGQTVPLHKGLLARLEIQKDRIVSVGTVPAFDDDWARLRFQRAAIPFQIPGAPQLLLELDAPVRAVGLLGPGPAKTRVIVSTDDPEALRKALMG